MHPTDTSEAGLEALICRSLVDEAGYTQGDSNDYDRDHAVDLPNLLGFPLIRGWQRATRPQFFPMRSDSGRRRPSIEEKPLHDFTARNDVEGQ